MRSVCRPVPAGASSSVAGRGARARVPSLPSLVAAGAVVLGALLVAVGSPRGVHAAVPLDDACEVIRDLAADVEDDVTLGVVVVDLQTGDRCEVDADREFRSASLYKTVVAAELYRQAAEGLVDLEARLTIEPRHHIDDPEDLRPEEPYTVGVYEAAERMITFSDNGTAFALRELLGEGTVDDATEWLGMPSTTLVNEFMTTPADQAHLFTEIFAGRVVSQFASNAILDMLRRQEIVDGIPQGLPDGTLTAHKTGTLEDFLHDAGIVYAPGGAFVLVVMTENEDFDAALETIQDVAAAAYVPFASAGQPLLSARDAFYAESPAGTFLPYVGTEAPPTPGSETNGTFTELAVATGGASGLADTTTEVASAPTPVITLTDDSAASPLLDAMRDPVVLAGILGLLAVAVALPAFVLRRSPSRAHARYGTDALRGADALPQQSEARLRADRSERGLVMRFGSRRDGDNSSSPMSPASRSVAEVAQQPVVPSKRLQRVAEHFRSQGELLATMRDQFEEEMEPLHDLIVKQAQAMQSLLQNLEERLRPLNEYADGEEANLTALEERIKAGGQDHVARSFSQYLEEQRGRISQTREQIDRQRLPFLEYGDAQRDTVEAALSRFDNDIEALEANLAEQRRVMVRMLDAMRSETFTAVKDYLDSRQQVIAQMAESGSTDPAEIGRSVAALRRSMEELAGKSDYVRGLLQQAETADRSLMDAAPAPRPLREAPEPALELDDEEQDEASA